MIFLIQVKILRFISLIYWQDLEKKSFELCFLGSQRNGCLRDSYFLSFFQKLLQNDC